ncbi:galactoside 3(4)-L-fucosyltransferase-like, partial [Tropilaelaps mercedesae]
HNQATFSRPVAVRFHIGLFVTCRITYPELIPHSKPFDFKELPYYDREVVSKVADGNHTVLVWTATNQALQRFNNNNNRELCEFRNCFFTSDRGELNVSAAVVFYDADLDVNDLPSRVPHQLWVFHSQEPPTSSKLSPAFDGLFNWTMSYSPKDDVHVPFFTMCREGHRPPERNFSSKEFAAIWFVDSCHPTNLPYVNLLQIEFPVHIVGPCSPQGFYCTDRHVCMDRLLPLYKFALVFEESLCTDFVTSHLREILRYDVIPVVWGGAHYSEILPKESFVVASEYGNPKELARMLYRFRSDELFRKALNARRGVHAVRVDWMCRLCEALNKRKQDARKKAYKALSAARMKAGKCRIWKRGFFRTYRSTHETVKDASDE